MERDILPYAVEETAFLLLRPRWQEHRGCGQDAGRFRFPSM